MKITTHILTVNAQTLRRAVESILPLGNVLIGTWIDDPEIHTVGNHYRIPVIRLKPDRMDVMRNLLVSRSTTEWQFYLEPWEALVSGHNAIQNCDTTSKVSILRGDVVARQTRLWKKDTLKFTKPVFETLDGGSLTNATICADVVPLDDHRRKLLSDWKESEPTRPEIDYYRSCVLLADGKYADFIRLAEHYLFNERSPTQSAVSTRYYAAFVYTYFLNDPSAAIRHLAKCLAVKPLMAEFWCLLGDVYFYRYGLPSRATEFYRNALFFGTKRSDDDWFRELSKYDTYPTSMIEKVKEIVNTLPR